MTATPLQTRDSGSIPPWAGRAAIAILIAFLLWQLSKVVLVIFASVLVAISLCSLARPISKHTGAPHSVAVLISALIVLAIIGWPFTEFGSRLWAQFDEIASDVPKAVSSIKQSLEEHASVRFIEEIGIGIDFSKLAAPVAAHATVIISALGSLASYAVLLLFGGVYFALTPDFYLNGLIRLTPASYRDPVQRFVTQSGQSLRTWLATQLLVVILNGLFAGIGLWALGVDGAAALGVLAGLLSFIPYLGTIVAMVVAVLAALPQGTTFAFYALIVLGTVSVVEGYFVTPYVQSKALSLPPVILIFSIFAFGILFGALGVVLAAPLTVVSMVALDTFYKPDSMQGPARKALDHRDV